MPKRYAQRPANWLETASIANQRRVSDLLEAEKLSLIEVARIKGNLEHELAIEADQYQDYRQFVADATDKKNRKHPRFNEWLAECDPAWDDDDAPNPPLFKEWLDQKERAANFKTTLFIASDCVITYEHPISANLAAINSQISALLEKQVNLMDYQTLLGITIFRIDKPEQPKRKIGFIDV